MKTLKIMSDFVQSPVEEGITINGAFLSNDYDNAAYDAYQEEIADDADENMEDYFGM